MAQLTFVYGDTIGQAFFRMLLIPLIYTDEVGSRFYCLSVCKVMCPEFSGILSSSVSLGVMPPALALASVPLVRVVWYGGVPSSAALTPAAVAPLVASQVSELELSTLPSVMPSQPGLGLSLSLVTSQKIVDRAHSGQFVDMRDLLTVLQQLDTVGGHHAFPFLPGMLKPRLRDVTSLLAGIYWFLAYM